MKSFFSGLMLSAFFVFSANAQSPSVSSQSRAAAQFASVAPTLICVWQTVPTNWVIESYTYSPACGGYYKNSIYVRPPISPDIVCIQSTIPAGYVVTQRVNYRDCNFIGDGSLVIKIPSSFENVCAFSPIPYGFVITATYTSWICGFGVPNNMYVIQKF